MHGTFKMEVNNYYCCQGMCHFGLSLPISLKPVGGIPSHLGHKTLGKRSATVRACPQILYYLGLAIVFIDEYNPSKRFKMASSSFEVTKCSILICHPFDCCKRGYVVLGLSNSSLAIFFITYKIDT